MSQQVTPISGQQFREALYSVWRAPPSPNQRHVLGLAVSGGVDSMALAHLSSRLQKEQSGPMRLRFRAFVVDHQARQGSLMEARSVALKLRKIGLPTTVIKLGWGARVPAHLHNFETVARRLRYRALGRACRHFRLRSLLLAHHEDDQVETVLMRIVNCRTGVGLRGMKPQIDIPECFGLYGIGASGGLPSIPDSPTPAYIIRGDADRCHSIGLANGGVTLHRPLLRFSKDRLIATCEESGTPWVEDATNSDVGITPRNALRYLLQSGKLPRPLRKAALLRLCNSWQTVAESQDADAIAAFQKLAIKRFDLRSGRLVFSLPLHPAADSPTNSTASMIQRVMQREGEIAMPHAAKLIERISSLVSPCESIAKDQLANTVNRMFTHTPAQGIVESRSGQDSQAMTAAGVLWNALLRNSSSDNHGWEWTLTRQALKANQAGPNCTWTKNLCQGQEGEAQAPFWTWQLFDGRFWIRARHSSSQKIIARLLRKEDMRALRAHLRGPRQYYLDRLLSESAPGEARYTLPVLTVAMNDPVVALPTLGFQVDLATSSMNWQVQYKRVVLPDGISLSSKTP